MMLDVLASRIIVYKIRVLIFGMLGAFLFNSLHFIQNDQVILSNKFISLSKLNITIKRLNQFIVSL